MGQANRDKSNGGKSKKARLMAAAALTALVMASPSLAQGGAHRSSPQLAEEVYGKEVPIDKEDEAGKPGEAGKQGKAGAGTTAGTAGQTARQPEARGGGDDGAFGVERPAPEDPDPNALQGGGEAAGGSGDGDDDRIE